MFSWLSWVEYKLVSWWSGKSNGTFHRSDNKRVTRVDSLPLPVGVLQHFHTLTPGRAPYDWSLLGDIGNLSTHTVCTMSTRCRVIDQEVNLNSLSLAILLKHNAIDFSPLSQERTIHTSNTHSAIEQQQLQQQQQQQRQQQNSNNSNNCKVLVVVMKWWQAYTKDCSLNIYTLECKIHTLFYPGGQRLSHEIHPLISDAEFFYLKSSIRVLTVAFFLARLSECNSACKVQILGCKSQIQLFWTHFLRNGRMKEFESLRSKRVSFIRTKFFFP